MAEQKDTPESDFLAALKEIAAMQTWNENARATPQVRLSKADISNLLDRAITTARSAISAAKPTA